MTDGEGKWSRAEEAEGGSQGSWSNLRKVPTAGACSRLIIPGSSLRYFLNLQVTWVRVKDIAVSSVLPSQMSFPVPVLGLWGLPGVEGCCIWMFSSDFTATAAALRWLQRMCRRALSAYGTPIWFCFLWNKIYSLSAGVLCITSG